jgi:hypothetical protein
VVRFSLRVSSEWEEKAYGTEDKRGAWLRWRLSLLSRALLSSLFSNTRQPDKVFLLADRADQAILSKDIFGSDSVEWLFSTRDAAFEPLQQRLWDLFGNSSLVISRIDSDDMVCLEYGEELLMNAQSLVAKGEIGPRYIVFTEGFRSDGIQIQPVYYSCSPFLSLYCPAFSGQNVYSIGHEDVLKFSPVAISTPAWCQFVHGTNVSNRFFEGIMDFDTIDRSGHKLLFGQLSNISLHHLHLFPFLGSPHVYR